jgi:hypothetical protein
LLTKKENKKCWANALFGAA